MVGWAGLELSPVARYPGTVPRGREDGLHRSILNGLKDEVIVRSHHCLEALG